MWGLVLIVACMALLSSMPIVAKIWHKKASSDASVVSVGEKVVEKKEEHKDAEKKEGVVQLESKLAQPEQALPNVKLEQQVEAQQELPEVAEEQMPQELPELVSLERLAEALETHNT